MYPTRLEVDKFFGKLRLQWCLSVSEVDVGVEYSLSKGSRTALFLWETNRPEEMWFWLADGDRYDLEDWTEMFESEEQETLFNYLELIATRYLERPTRISKRWIFFGHETLEYEENGKWRALRSPT